MLQLGARLPQLETVSDVHPLQSQPSVRRDDRRVRLCPHEAV